jgi:glycosyltransferase involved in cell wall biosynthesis
MLSIVIPTYEMKGQGVFFLKRCIASIEKQVGIERVQLEVVISDQSHDEVIESFCQRHSLGRSFVLHYHRTLTSRGIAAHNLNTAIHIAQGQYVKILFQDDILVEDNYLATIFSVIANQKPQCILTKATHTKDGEHFFNPIIPKDNPYLLFGNNTVSSPSVLTVSKIVLELIPFDEHLKLLFDCDFYYQLFQACKSIEVILGISIANGVWDGQTQFSISHKEFTGEVRYLNWKYPRANLTQLLPAYEQFFAKLHPDAPFPFNTNIQRNVLQGIFWQLQAYLKAKHQNL